MRAIIQHLRALLVPREKVYLAQKRDGRVVPLRASVVRRAGVLRR